MKRFQKLFYLLIFLLINSSLLAQDHPYILIKAKHIFDGHQFHSNKAVLIQDKGSIMPYPCCGGCHYAISRMEEGG